MPIHEPRADPTEPSRSDSALQAPTSQPLAQVVDLDRDEVRELWSFLHGDVMEPGVRVHLCKALGLCPRHSWGYAIVEIELWILGAGSRGGHQPFEVSLLYEDLLADVIRRLTHHRRWRRSVTDQLQVRASCRICDAIKPSGVEPTTPSTGYAGADTDVLTLEANARIFTTAWLKETEVIWRPNVCPACLSGAARDHDMTPTGFSDTDIDTLCRVHLIVGDQVRHIDEQQLAARLETLRRRLLRLLESMTEGGTPSTMDDDAAWVEALGWFAGWGLPLTLIA